MALPQIRTKGQVRLGKAHVLVVGAGGLGCPVLQYLSGAGVGTVTLYDPDVVEETNLHRQPLYNMSDIGQPKAQVAARHLRTCNPDVIIHAHTDALDPASAPTAVFTSDLVIDAADSYATSYTLSDTCQHHQIPLISASAVGQSGYVGGFCGGVPSLRAVFPDPPDNSTSCASAGVLGPVVGMIGAMQAQMALQVLLDHDPTPLGQLISINMETLEWGGFSFAQAKEPTNTIPFYAKTQIAPNDRIIELRDTNEAPTPAHPAAQRLEPEQIKALAPSPRRTILCCHSGLRAWRTAAKLADQGHRSLGILAANAQS